MSKRTCPNCGKVMSCSCQARIAKDGTKCCSSCIAQKNSKIDQATRFSPKI